MKGFNLKMVCLLGTSFFCMVYVGCGSDPSERNGYAANIDLEDADTGYAVKTEVSFTDEEKRQWKNRVGLKISIDDGGDIAYHGVSSGSPMVAHSGKALKSVIFLSYGETKVLEVHVLSWWFATDDRRFVSGPPLRLTEGFVAVKDSNVFLFGLEMRIARDFAGLSSVDKIVKVIGEKFPDYGVPDYRLSKSFDLRRLDLKQ